MPSYDDELVDKIIFELASGKTNKQIADDLDLNKNTVSRYTQYISNLNKNALLGRLKNILEKFNSPPIEYLSCYYDDEFNLPSSEFYKQGGLE